MREGGTTIKRSTGALLLVTSLLTMGCIGAVTADAQPSEECGTQAEDYYGAWVGRMGNRSDIPRWKITLYPPQKVDGEMYSSYYTDKTFTGEFVIDPGQRDKVAVTLNSEKAPLLNRTVRFEPICPSGTTRPDALRYHYKYGGPVGGGKSEWVDNFADLRPES
ncbi:hypothetical protein [Nocardia transvalensis]|uniref:hypothetical protein n=1 Tax=Nocardia transvalensis TaxID=37333 RepID=UPI0018945F3E|nr:hypothetical protein [Nocardia transvalensis]MBF6330724.1 hypothetical protein [Nocardia transvalensis]